MLGFGGVGCRQAVKGETKPRPAICHWLVYPLACTGCGTEYLLAGHLFVPLGLVSGCMAAPFIKLNMLAARQQRVHLAAVMLLHAAVHTLQLLCGPLDVQEPED